MPVLKTFRDGISPLGLIVAASFFGAALTPSMMPREPIVQAALAAVAASVGYEITLFARGIWRYLELPEPKGRICRLWLLAAIGISLAIIVYSLAKAASWQNATREAVGLPPLETAAPLFIVTVGLLIALVFWVIFRMAGAARRAVAALLAKVLPRRVGVVLSVVLVGWFLWAIVDGALVRNAFRAADASLLAADMMLEPDIEKPMAPEKTGSSQSLVRWEEMGRWGRNYVATAPTAKEIAEFSPGNAIDPVRVYVGRRSGDTAEARAQLALRELIRAGGFERSALVVVVPTGTGWMDPGAYDTLDFMLGGDVATVAVQYSYLSSFLALLAHPDYGVDQARVLFKTVYAHWTQLPKDSRPDLYVQGLSQGAFNSQATLPLFDMLGDPIQGAFWAGSPFFSRYWSEVRNQRNAGSPAWRPTYGNGSLVRVMDQYGGLKGNYAPWGPIRTVFLNYGSDPIVNFTFDTAFRPPAWMATPCAPDVSEKLSWFPLVTMLQIALDSLFALDVPRHGHYYVAPDYIDGWAAVIDPEGWSAEKAEVLKKIFQRRDKAM
ncbi:hypothetical protein FMN63_25530 [Stappia sp. BW2]|uniref:alpha/beta hydrolase n=1 Tax=Stappia sp. BW2 TaxID=2592622 RepID=UPI0011DEBE8B|nr:alpha/beta-hydrolase family protein [Stappia sp. BW2]TYC65735.1 hypothetical protein FMN63_25530 [Stappia sp. BW2]